MKKSIIAMAVAGALAVPAIASADATLYGHVMMAVDKAKDQKATIGTSGNAESRIGVRGTADTNIDGLTALYNMEFGVRTTQTGYGDDADNAMRTRLANVGLTGDWGTMLLGTIAAPQNSWVTGTTDVMTSSVTNNATDVGIFRVNNTAAYVSPDFNGFQFAAAVGASSEFGDKNADYYHVAAKYDAHGFYAAIGYIDVESTEFADGFLDNEDIKDTTSVALGYDFGPATIGATYTHLRIDGGANVKPWVLAGTYSVTDATTLKATYADMRSSQKSWAVEAQHDLSNMVTTFVGYKYANTDAREAGTDNSVFSTGMRVRF